MIMRKGLAESLLPPKLLNVGGRVAQTGAILGLAGTLYGLSKAVEKLRSTSARGQVLEELRREKSLTPDEGRRAEELFGLMARHAPDLAADKVVSKSFVNQGLSMSDEGVWGLLNTLVRTQKEIRDVQPALARPMGLATALTQVGKGMLGPA
jgi:hypothetical protein